MQNSYHDTLFSLTNLDSRFHREMGIFFRFCIINRFRIDFNSMERFVFIHLNHSHTDIDSMYWLSENKYKSSDLIRSYDFYCGDMSILETSDISILLEKLLNILKQQMALGLFIVPESKSMLYY